MGYAEFSISSKTHIIKGIKDLTLMKKRSVNVMNGTKKITV